MSAALMRFAKWLRTEYDFPVRVTVYLNPHRQFLSIHGEEAEASFFAPDDPTVEPRIRIATGDYEDLVAGSCRNDAIATYICCLAHEIIHYHQWLNEDHMWEENVDEEAEAILRSYERTVDEP